MDPSSASLVQWLAKIIKMVLSIKPFYNFSQALMDPSSASLVQWLAKIIKMVLSIQPFLKF